MQSHQHFILQKNILQDHHISIPLNAKILDFGCGAGRAIKSYRKNGYKNIYGYDIVDYWQEKSIQQFFINSNEKLLKHNGSFDFIFSDQVFEHVMNYSSTIKQIYDLLKPGGVSLHIFPNKNTIIEPHIKVPFAGAIQNPAYLFFWAMCGIRNEYQKSYSITETWKANKEFFIKNINYLSKREIFKHWSKKFDHTLFVESTYLKYSYGAISGLPKILKESKILGWLLGKLHVNVVLVRK